MGFWERLKKEEEPKMENRDVFSSSSATFASLFGSNGTITEEQVMKIPTAEACLNLISSTIAQMPIYLYKEHADGSVEKMVDDKRVTLLNHEPNELMNGYNFKKQIVKDYVLHGGAFVSVEKLGNTTNELYPLPARNLSITKYIKDGYKISADIKLTSIDGVSVGSPAREVKFKPYELMIALSDSKDGITSIGLLQKGEKIFQQASDEMEYTYNIFQRGALPLGLLKSAARLTQPAIDRLRESWAALYGGAKNSAKTVILEEGMDYQPLSMKPSDLQLNESKSGTNTEICKLFGVPESMITTAANKYGSIEQNQLHFLKHCLAPIIGSIEAGADRALLLESEKAEGYFFRFDTSELLRATDKERTEAVALGLEKGLFTINEARAKLDLPSIDEDVFMWGLQSVLFNPETGEMKVPNMGLTGGEQNGEQNTDPNVSSTKPVVSKPEE
jgi:HK97 family phage portal protein